ncbi:methyltransferase [Saccharothrix obliqua]|uniref:methyltransferase n=1 Tax=Saccharothrix obliqua TaxID=2861747 RepID=UPI001C5EAB36|nr:methyltransferase [Saccharothrix obliqua]MBW4721433.1 methyltransferase domain-containing protein [Saccharothrix obliqua]
MTTGLPGGAFAGIPAPPDFDLTRRATAFEPLGGKAFPVAQDRWERLVTTTTTTAPADRVWAALTEPARLREWFAVPSGEWAVRGAESTLDFEDGEFFYCATSRSTPPTGTQPGVLEHLWRWNGIGPAARVTWTVAPGPDGTAVTAVEEATNPPSDWRSWNGMGWPGILDQLTAHLRTGANTRWTWRRMGPYVQTPLPLMPFAAWEALTSPGAVKHWLQRSAGSLAPDDELTLVMGDASGTVRMRVTRLVDSGQQFPSYLPSLDFELRRPSWSRALTGHVWIEPAGLGSSLLQVFHSGWEGLDVPDPVAERRLLTAFWIDAGTRAQSLCGPRPGPGGPHGWSAGGGPPERRPEPDLAATFGFAQRVMADLGGGMTGLLGALGVRLGLFGALAAGPAGSAELAERTGLAERHVREWLWGMTSAGYLEVEDARERFTLPAAHAAVLAHEESPAHLGPGFELMASMATVVDEVAAAFREGRGVPHERYPEALYAAMRRMSATWLDRQLVDEWLPAVDGLVARLERGGAVVDVGSGGGAALIALARRFGAAGFVGYDLHAPAVARATEAAARAGVAERVRFERGDAAEALSGPLDLVTMFDVLHDAPDPTALLRAARQALAPANGVLLVLESKSAADPRDNTGPAAAVLHATSTLYCVPTALADGGPALGTLGLPRGKLVELATAAGFGSVVEVPVRNPLNSLFALRT